jgi:hypothetical protein
MSSISGHKTARLNRQIQLKPLDDSYNNEVYQMNDVTIPRNIQISSKFEDNSIEYIRRRLRINKIDHIKFDP